MAEKTRLYSAESAQPPKVVEMVPGEPTVVQTEGTDEKEDDGEDKQ